MKVPSFVVTLAGLLAFQGVGFVITQGNTISSMPPSFQRLGQEYVSGQVVLLAFIIVGGLYGLYLVYSLLRDDQARRQRHVGRLLGLVGGGLLLAFLVLSTNMLFPIPVLIVAAAAVLLTLLARRTRFGRHLYAIGGNRTAAQLSGIPVNRNIRAMFMLMGVLYALAGLLLLSRLNGAPPQGATFLELEAIAAAVIGGTSLSGGVGTVTGALLGALFTASVSNGLSIMNVSTYYQLIASGAILIIAVFLDIQSKRRSGLT
jgi:D-xylose transport system permease protein